MWKGACSSLTQHSPHPLASRATLPLKGRVKMAAIDLHPPTSRRPLAVAALCLGTIAVQFDSAVNIAFPDLVKSFGLQIPEIQWIVISYTLTYAALMLVFGRVGDIFGHRTIFLAGAATSAVA